MDGTSVGTIYLNLKIMDTVREQLSEVSRKAQKSAQVGFADVGKAMGDAMRKPVEEAAKATQKPFDDMAKAMQKPMEDAQRQIEQQAKDIDAAIERLYERENKRLSAIGARAGEPLQAARRYNVPIPEQQAADSQQRQKLLGRDTTPAVTAPVNTFRVAENAVDLLNQKLDNTNALIGEQQRKVGELAGQYAQVTSASPDGLKLEAQMTAAEGKLIALQQSAMRTQQTIEKVAKAPAIAAEKAAEKLRKAQEKLVATQQKAAAKLRTAQDGAVKQSMGGIKKQTASAGRGFRSLGASIKSSIRSEFLMTSLYAFFKAFKAMMANAMTQNKEFAKSLGSVKVSLSAAFQPIMQAIMPMLNALMGTLASAAKAFAVFVSAIFGKTYAQSVAAAKQAKAAQGQAAKNNNTADIDELNIIDKGQQEGGTDFGAVDTSGMEAVQSLAEKVRAKIDELMEPLKSISFDNLTAAFDKLKAAAAPLTEKLFAGLESAYKNIFVPFSKWTVEDAAPKFLELLAKAAESANKALDVLKPLGNWLWENFLQPLASWTGGVVLEIVQRLTDMYARLGEWIDENKAKLEGVFAAIAPFAQAAIDSVMGCIDRFKTLALGIRQHIFNIFMGVLDFIVGVFSGDWEQAWDGITAIVSGRLDIIKELFTYLWESLCAAFETGVGLIRLIVEPIVEWFDLTVIQPIATFFTGLWDKVKTLASEAYTKVTGIWQAVAGWITTNVTDPVAQRFTELWEGVKECFNTAWENMGKGLKGFINGWIGLFEDLGNRVVDMVNGIIDTLNKLQIDLPNGESFGFDLSHVEPISLPRLATGAVIPPNREFMAILGDQRHGTNIEAPADLIRQIVREETAGMRQADDRPLIVVMEIDGAEVGRKVVDWQSGQGYSVGGVFANCY